MNATDTQESRISSKRKIIFIVASEYGETDIQATTEKHSSL